MHWIDPDHLPQTRGKVSRVVLNHHGHLDGLVLRNGLEVHVPPHLSGALLPRVRTGDAVHVRGLRVRGLPLLVAVEVSPAKGKPVVDTGPDGHPHPKALPTKGRWGYSGKVERLLHGPRGNVHGALLDDGTVLRFAPHSKHAGRVLTVGASVDVEGEWLETPHGVVIAVDHAAKSGGALKPL